MPHSLCWSSPEWALGKLSLSMREYGTPFTYNISAKANKFNYLKKSFENSWALCQSINKKTINPKSHVSHEISDSFKFCLLYLDCFQNIYTSLQKKKKRFQSLQLTKYSHSFWLKIKWSRYGGEILIQVLGNRAQTIKCRSPFYDKDKAL